MWLSAEGKRLCMASARIWRRGGAISGLVARGHPCFSSIPVACLHDAGDRDAQLPELVAQTTAGNAQKQRGPTLTAARALENLFDEQPFHTPNGFCVEVSSAGA